MKNPGVRMDKIIGAALLLAMAACADILVIDKEVEFYQDSLLTKPVSFLPPSAEGKVIRVAGETKLAYAFEFLDSLFLDSVSGYVSAKAAENKKELVFFGIKIEEKGLRFSPEALRYDYDIVRNVNIVIDKVIYVGLVRKGTVDTAFFPYADLQKMDDMGRSKDSLAAAAEKARPGMKRKQVLDEITSLSEQKIAFNAVTVKMIEKRAIKNPVLSYLLIDQDRYYENPSREKFNFANYYIRGRKNLYWIQKGDAMRVYQDTAAYYVEQRLIEGRKQYVRENNISGLTAKAILNGKIVLRMADKDVLASIGPPLRKSPPAERFGIVQSIWFYKDFKLFFLDGKLVKWE